MSLASHTTAPYDPICASPRDGEIVTLGQDGRALFSPLLYRRLPASFYAFDLLFLDGHDLRTLPLTERKRRLRDLIPAAPSRLLYVDHVEARGIDVHQAACLCRP